MSNASLPALTLADVYQARLSISGTAVRTPLVPSPHMSEVSGRAFLLKLEIAQPTGAFKLRGAANAVFNLPGETAGVVCCSTGNHGRGVAYAARARGLRAVVCMSSLVPQAKVDGIKAVGGEICIVGRSQDDALAESERLRDSEGLAEISPFDDPLVIAGQGTIGLELLEERPDIDTILVPLSGGGLAAGIALAAKAIKPAVKVIGISMDRGAAMHASIAAGHPVEVEEVASLADSLGGGIGLQQSFVVPALPRPARRYGAGQRGRHLSRHADALLRGPAGGRRRQRRRHCGGSIRKAQAVGKGAVATIVTGRNLDMDVFTRIVTGADVDLDGYAVKGARYAQ